MAGRTLNTGTFGARCAVAQGVKGTATHTERLDIRISPAELETINAAAHARAQRLGRPVVSVAAWVRDVLAAAAARELGARRRRR